MKHAANPIALQEEEEPSFGVEGAFTQ